MTRHMIDRLGPALRGSSALKLPSASGWITVRLETLSDIDLLATLVSAALLATGSAPGLTEPDWTDRCSQWPGERPTRRPGRRARMAIRWLCKPLPERRWWQGRRVPSSRHDGPDSDAVADFWLSVARMAAGMSVRRGVCRCDGPWTAHGFCVLAPGSGRGALIRRAREFEVVLAQGAAEALFGDAGVGGGEFGADEVAASLQCGDASGARAGAGEGVEDGAAGRADLDELLHDLDGFCASRFPSDGSSDVATLAVPLMCKDALTGGTYDIDGGQQLLPH